MTTTDADKNGFGASARYVYRTRNADEPVARFPTLTPAELHVVLLYYHRHQPALDHRLAAWLDHSQRACAAQQRPPAPVVEKLRRVRAEQDASVVGVVTG